MENMRKRKKHIRKKNKGYIKPYIKNMEAHQKIKGYITAKVLEILEDTVVNTADLLEAFLSAGYGASSRRIDYEISAIRRDRRRRLSKNEKEKERKAKYTQLKQKYYCFIHTLKKDGLIKEVKNDKSKAYASTKKGNMKLREFRERFKNKLPETDYKLEGKARAVIAIFDIPETERRKRGWLRSALKNIGFEMVQKSVWLGNVKLPKIFIDDLYRLRIINFVEIFEISKSGSLKNLRH